MARKPPPAYRHRVYLLGAFHIQGETQSIHLPTRKIESLLAYLILHSEAHARERLATLFWGDSSDAKAHGSLRKALTFLRKTIGDEIILADREAVQLNPEFPLWVDVIAFEGQTREFLADSSPELDRIDLNLYQGDLLSDYYDDWISPLRDQYHRLYIDTLLREVDRLRALSEYKTAITYARKILANDPANERAYQHLMFCHITLGDRNLALQEYEACKRALQDELAVEPARETRALANWIRQSTAEITSLAACLTNLPIPISSFVGRGRELAILKGLVSKTRLVTLTGAGGSGKTRLAIHAATDLIDSFKDGVWWVELAPLMDASLVPSAVAKAFGINAQTDKPLVEILEHFLHTKQTLLILDNCEHLIEACAQLTEQLLSTCPDLKILCTSREALGLTGENLWPVPTLTVPIVETMSLAELLMQYEGIRLFVERAGAVKTDFTLNDKNAPDVVQICQRLDGIPLAIELAAARVKTMSVSQIAARLHDRFHLLTSENRTTQARHQTLRAAIDWSYDLLSEEERRLFCRLSVFSGGWTLDAAESVCSGQGLEKHAILNLLARLVDKSLVILTDAQRYGMLETMRQYGNEKLVEEGKPDWLAQQHLDYYLKMAGIGDENIRGSEQLEWFQWFEAEKDNLAGAMEMALGSQTTLEKGCELVCAMCWYWVVVGDFVIMKYWLEVALSRSAELGRTSTRAKTLFCAGYYSVQGLNWMEPPRSQATIEESLELWRELGSGFSLECGQCLLGLGWIRKSILHDDEGYNYFNQAITIFQETGNIWWHAWALNLMGALFVEDARDLQVIHQVLEEEFDLGRKTGDQCVSALPLFDLGTLALERHDFVEAQGYFQESLQRYNKFRSKGLIFQAVNCLADIARGLRQYDKAGLYYNENIPLAQVLMYESSLSAIYRGLGYVALHRGNSQQAEAYFHQAIKIAREHDLVQETNLCVAGLAGLAAVRKKPIVSARLFGVFFTQIEGLQKESKSKKKIIGPVDQMEIDEYLALCKTQMEEAVFSEVWNAGRALTLDDALSEIHKVFGDISKDY
jgi:non-specific serine/threonine protein kinase